MDEQGLAVALPEPVFADIDCVQAILTTQDGSLFHLIDRVVHHRQSNREMCSGLPNHDGIGPLPIPRAQRSANRPSRLPSHTACAILRPEMTHKGLT